MMKKRPGHLKIYTGLENDRKGGNHIWGKNVMPDINVNKNIRLKIISPVNGDKNQSNSINRSLKTKLVTNEQMNLTKPEDRINQINSCSLTKPKGNVSFSEREPNFAANSGDKNNKSNKKKLNDFLRSSSSHRKSEPFSSLNMMNKFEKAVPQNNEEEKRLETEPSKVLPSFDKNIVPERKVETPRVTSSIFNKFSPINTLTSEPLTSKSNTNHNLNNDSNCNTFNKSSAKPENGINVMSLLSSQHIPLTLSTLRHNFPHYENTKFSSKAVSYIKAYAANTHQGTVRNYNEDRVSIILNIIQPSGFTGKAWPKCSVFGVYDGHGGSGCADYLRDNLYQFVIKDPKFPENPTEAIIKGFENAEKEFINNHALNKSGEIVDRSGSCAVVMFVIDDVCYVANVGDSRAVMSNSSGKAIQVLSDDHKPNEHSEEKRIVDAGGKIYQTQTPTKNFNLSAFNGAYNLNITPNQVLLGPYRVLPGRLSVSRTFGDVEAKLSRFGGMQNVLIAVPEVKSFKINEENDFVVLGCDGIYDQMTNKDIVDSVWMTTKDGQRSKTVHLQCSQAVDMMMKTCLVRKALDNITCIIISFENFEKTLANKNANAFNNSHTNTNSYYMNTAPSKYPASPSSNHAVNPDSPTKVTQNFEPVLTELVLSSNDIIKLKPTLPLHLSSKKVVNYKSAFPLDAQNKEKYMKTEQSTMSPKISSLKSNSKLESLKKGFYHTSDISKKTNMLNSSNSPISNVKNFNYSSSRVGTTSYRKSLSEKEDKLQFNNIPNFGSPVHSFIQRPNKTEYKLGSLQLLKKEQMNTFSNGIFKIK